MRDGASGGVAAEGAVAPEIGKEIVGGFEGLDEEVFEAEVLGAIEGVLIFGGGKGAVEGGAVGGAGDGGVLAHQGEGEEAAELGAEHFEDAARVFGVSGQNEVADKHAGLRGIGAGGIEGVQKSLGGDHEAQGFHGGFGVAFVAHDEAGEGRVGEFEVGEEDVDVFGVARNHVRQMVAGGVEEDRQADAVGAQPGDEFLDVRPEMVGGDEVEVVDAPGGQVCGQVEELVGGNEPALAAGGGDLPVLAEKAVTGASGKEDGAGALRA